MNNDWWYNWWASYSEIAVPGALCPLSPESRRQTANAVLASAEWQHAFMIAAIVTAASALIAVLWIYETDQMGHSFRRRWLKGLGLTAVGSFLLVLGWLAFVAKVNISGCEYGSVVTRI